ncbi:MAG: pantoate--beta-alanine ligase, partial [Sphingobacteriales bacterium]|nr:pantoate--beta-alanine ligase [Sphingobacteriales bacterium]
EIAKKQADVTVASIFVNPTQFNDINDFNKYPNTIEQDIYQLEKTGCDVLFLPSVDEIYPAGNTTIHYEIGFLEGVLEGEFRPNHFQGVCQVVHRLLKIVAPTHLFLGQKDYQQCMVIKKLIEILHLPVSLVICPTERETDGLAMSSRNMRLNEAERKTAISIYEALSLVKENLVPGRLNAIKEKATAYLLAKKFKVDYVEIARADTLETIENWDGNTKLVLLAAAFLNEVRLIDNITVNPHSF